MKRDNIFVYIAIFFIFIALIWFMFRSQNQDPIFQSQQEAKQMFEKEYGAKPYTGKKIVLSNEEWKKRLTPEEYKVIRLHETEKAGSGRFDEFDKKGIYDCAACDLPLFSSDDKFLSKSGWPSFTKPIDPSHVGYQLDNSLFSTRVEVHCNRCGGHLGHVFNDGPPPWGHRYCINSVALKFVPEKIDRED